MTHFYAEMSPHDVDSCWKARSPAILPWGALEWHGDHLPLGLDGMVAEHFGKMLAEQADGVLLPTTWLPITTLPHRHSLSVKTETLQRILDDVIAGLVAAGAKTVVLLTGHYAQGHLSEFYETAVRSMDDYPDVRVVAGTPLEPLGDDALLDHAGRYETSQLLALRPDLVKLSNLPPEINAKRDGVLGADPRQGSATEGHELFRSALAAWTTWLAISTRESLYDHYRSRFDTLRPYVDAHYRGSWEDAIHSWWETKS